MTAVLAPVCVSLTAVDPIRLARVRPDAEGREIDRWYAPDHQEVGWIPGVGDRVTVLRLGPMPAWGNAMPETLACWATVLEADGTEVLPRVEVEQPRALASVARGRGPGSWRYPEDPADEGVGPAPVETLRLPVESDHVWLHLWDSRIGMIENVCAEITCVRSTESVDLFIPACQDAPGSARLGRGRTGDTLLRVSRGNCINSWSYD